MNAATASKGVWPARPREQRVHQRVLDPRDDLWQALDRAAPDHALVLADYERPGRVVVVDGDQTLGRVRGPAPLDCRHAAAIVVFVMIAAVAVTSVVVAEEALLQRRQPPVGSERPPVHAGEHHAPRRGLKRMGLSPALAVARVARVFVESLEHQRPSAS